MQTFNAAWGSVPLYDPKIVARAAGVLSVWAFGNQDIMKLIIMEVWINAALNAALERKLHGHAGLSTCCTTP